MKSRRLRSRIASQNIAPIKDEFCSEKDQTGFSKLIQDMTGSGVWDIKSKKHYVHRLCQDGTPLEYYAIVGKKQEDIPNSMVSN